MMGLSMQWDLASMAGMSVTTGGRAEGDQALPAAGSTPWPQGPLETLLGPVAELLWNSSNVVQLNRGGKGRICVGFGEPEPALEEPSAIAWKGLPASGSSLEMSADIRETMA